VPIDLTVPTANYNGVTRDLLSAAIQAGEFDPQLGPAYIATITYLVESG
jgi:hypothetical protein